MADLSIVSVLVSAGVAAGTTLVIEFAAKPALDVRRERILRRDRDKHQLARRLTILDGRVSRAELSLALRSVVDVMRDLVTGLDELRAELALVTEHLPPDIAKLLKHHIMSARALCRCERARQQATHPDRAGDARTARH
jgi:hypothetical protein